MEFIYRLYFLKITRLTLFFSIVILLLMRKSYGFTIAELVIVVAILMILLGLGGTSYVNSQISGRDARRKGDMEALQQAFEQYFPDNGNQYNADCKNMASGYIRGEYPTDPRGLPSHKEYQESCTLNGYCVCALMEREDTGNSCTEACTFTGICLGTKDWYCVANQQ